MAGIAAAGRRREAAAGLTGPVEIIVDRWGIPHIYAGAVRDVFFAQGWNAARERLWPSAPHGCRSPRHRHSGR